MVAFACFVFAYSIIALALMDCCLFIDNDKLEKVTEVMVLLALLLLCILAFVNFLYGAIML